jgi:flavin-binding protein dodecin
LSLLVVLIKVGKTQTAVKEAVKTIRNVHAIEVFDITAQVDPNTGYIKEYRVAIKLAFGVER